MPVTDLPGYYPEVLDGGLGVMPASTAGLFGVVGVCQKGTTNIKFAIDSDDVAEEYGLGSMPERIEDAFNNGARQIGIKRAVPSTAGTVSSVTQKKYGDPTASGGGQATVTADKNSGVSHPYNDRSFRLKITVGGDMDDARYKISRNDGLTWGSVQRFVVTTAGPPRKAEIDMGNGTYIEFTEAATPADSFLAGDSYRWSTAEAKASSADILSALEDLINWTNPNGGQGLEYIYVAARPPVDQTKTNIKAFWTDLATKAENLWTSDYRPIWIIVDAPSMDETQGSETVWMIDDWIALINSVSAEYRHVRLAVNAGYALLTSANGERQVRPMGGCAAGLVSDSKLHHSIGWVRYKALANAVAIYPYHPEKAVDDETLGSGDGSQTTFTGNLAETPVVPWSVVITSDDLTPEEFVDGGDGILYDSTSGAVSGTIDYDTGEYSVTFATAPAAGKTVTGDYSYYTLDEMDKGKLALLNDAHFITLRLWIGYGIVTTDDWMMANATSDYSWIRYRRIMDECVRQVGIANTPWVSSPGITEDDLAAYKADLSRPLEAMKVSENDTDQPIMDYKLTLRPDDNIWSNGIVHAKIEIVPTPTKKKLEATFQLRTKIEE